MNLCTIKYWMISAAALAVLTQAVYAEIITASAYGATPTRALDAEDECPIELPSNKGFTGAEEWAWRQICSGRPAIMPKPSSDNGKNERCGAPEPERADNWAIQSTKRHTLSSRFIKLVTAHAPYTEVSAKPLVHIECAIVDGRIDLSNEEIRPELRFRNSLLRGELDVSGAHFHHGLLIDGSVAGNVNGLNATVEGQLKVINSDFTETFLANNLDAGGDVFLVNTKFKDVSLYGANIEENLELIHSIFTGTFLANNLNAGNDVLLEYTKFMQAELAGANIEKNLVVIHSNFMETFLANNLKAGGDVLFRETKFKEVRLYGANIEKNLWIIHSNFTETFLANNLKAGGDVTFLKGTKFSAGVSLVDAKIEGKLNLQGPSFSGELDLSHAQILESFILYQHQGGGDFIPLWEDGSNLILHNAYAKALQAKMPNSWKINRGIDFVPFDLNGFTYDRLDGMNVGTREDLEKIIEWVEKSTLAIGIEGDYRPQPYRQLAKVLREMGATDQAKNVDIARYDHYYSVQSRWKKLEGWLKKSADYGIRLWPTFRFFIAVWLLLVLTQTIVLSRHLFGRIIWRSRGERWYYCFAYSFENLIPVHLMKHSPYRERIDLKGRMRHVFFWFRLFGFIVVFIATILIVLTSFIGPE